jgi:uncharacterized integral membrane protein
VLINSNLKNKREIKKENERKKTGYNMFTVLLIRLIIFLDFIAANTDFIKFK